MRKDWLLFHRLKLHSFFYRWNSVNYPSPQCSCCPQPMVIVVDFDWCSPFRHLNYYPASQQPCHVSLSFWYPSTFGDRFTSSLLSFSLFVSLLSYFPAKMKITIDWQKLFSWRIQQKRNKKGTGEERRGEKKTRGYQRWKNIRGKVAHGTITLEGESARVCRLTESLQLLGLILMNQWMQFDIGC